MKQKLLNYVVHKFWTITMVFTVLIMLNACDNDSETTPEPVIITPEYNALGSWYSVDKNRELRFDKDGRIYLTYADVAGADSKRGNYFLDYSSSTVAKLSELGLNSKKDTTFYTLSWSDENTFTLSSFDNTTTYHRVKDTLIINVGESARSNFITQYDNCKVVDERLISIDRGQIKTSGPKGYTFIEVNDNKTVYYVNVRVGVDEYFYELWYDYGSLLDCNEQELISTMGTPTYLHTEEGCLYELSHDVSPIISEVNFVFRHEKVIGCCVDIADGVSLSTVETYIRDKYYLIGINNNALYVYASKKEGFDYYLVLDKDERMVMYYSQKYNQTLWEDMTRLFGYTKEKAKGYFSGNTLSYEEERYLEYAINNSSSNITAVGMWFNGKGLLLNQIVLEYKQTLTEDEVDAFLCQEYIFEEDGSDSNGKYRMYFNEESTVGVLLYPNNRIVLYYDLTQEREPDEPEPVPSLLPDFFEGLDKTQAQVKSIFGEPYNSDESKLSYVDINDVIDRAIFFFNSTGLCYEVMTRHIENVTSNMIVDYFNSKYYVYEGIDNVWINAKTYNDATAAIFYYPDNRIIDYMSLVNQPDSEVKRKSIQQHKCPAINQMDWSDKKKEYSNLRIMSFNHKLINSIIKR